MDITASAIVSTVAASQGIQAPLSVSAATTASSDANAMPTDSVTVSEQAQQALATASTASNDSTTIAPPTTAATTVPSWSSDAVKNALTALNDTSGNTPASDQISAYQMLSGMVANSSNFDTSNSANANAVDVATAFSTSAFTQHVQSLMAANNSYTAQANSGMQLSETWQRQLNAFDNLSSDDQQILVAGISTSAAQQHPGTQAFTVDSWKQYSQARIEVNRATEAAASDPTADKSSAASTMLAALTASYVDPATFTANAQAYFGQFGPAPAATADQQAADNAAAPPPPSNTSLDATQVRAQYQAIAAVSDTSGKTSLADQLSAYQQLAGGFGSQQNAAVHMAAVNAFTGSAFFAKVQTVTQSYEQQSWAGRSSSEVSSAKAQINAFSSLSSDDQKIIATLSQPAGSGATPQSYLAGLISGLKNAAQGDAINAASKTGNQTMYEALIAELNQTSDTSAVFKPSIQAGTQVNQNA